ncbi:MAG: hypothetical protein LBQ57_10385, partial [Spirochaetales bacterium]|nr:hypothetical protein [Spirochaetales bacterium]
GSAAACQAVKTRPEKLQSNFVSVFAQDGRSRPFNPLRPTVFFGLWPLYTPKVFLGPRSDTTTE